MPGQVEFASREACELLVLFIVEPELEVTSFVIPLLSPRVLSRVSGKIILLGCHPSQALPSGVVWGRCWQLVISGERWLTGPAACTTVPVVTPPNALLSKPCPAHPGICIFPLLAIFRPYEGHFVYHAQLVMNSFHSLCLFKSVCFENIWIFKKPLEGYFLGVFLPILHSFRVLSSALFSTITGLFSNCSTVGF